MKNTLHALLIASLSCCLFARCSNAPETASQAQETATAPVPVFEGHIYLPVSVGDSICGEFIFDTGASDLYIDSLFHARSLADALPAGNGRIGGAGRNMQSVRLLLRPVDFTLQGKLYTATGVTPLVHLKEILGKKADGIVGLNFFTGKYLSIDYLNGRFCVGDTLPDTTGYRSLALQQEKGKLLARARVSLAGKTIEGVFVVDTGSGGTIDLTSATAREYGLTEAEMERTAYRNSSGGIGGETFYTNCLAQEVALGDFAIKDIGISYSLDDAGSLGGKRLYDGLIGNGIWSRFDVIFDLRDMRLYLRPNALYGQPVRNYSHDLLYVDRTDICEGFVLNGMAIGGAGELSGLKSGDILTAVDSIPVGELSRRQLHDRLTDTTKSAVCLSVLRDGQVRQATYRPALTL